MLLQKGMTDDYLNMLIKKFCCGSICAQKLFLKYCPNNSVINPHFQDTPYFDRRLKAIKMSFANDFSIQLGEGTVFFHEHGHLVDYFCGEKVSLDQEFLNAIEDDYYCYISMIYSNYASLSLEDLRLCISFIISGYENASISELFSALSGGYFQGELGHSPEYWDKERMFGYEAFAHFYEAQFNPKRLIALKRFFPTAVDIFNKKIKALCD